MPAMKQGVRILAFAAAAAALGGCAALDPAPPVALYPQTTSPKLLAKPPANPNPIQLASATEPRPATKPGTRPAYAMEETLPIDLPTVIRLVDGNSPAVGFAQARVREAQARLDRAELQWLPNFSLGTAYN